MSDPLEKFEAELSRMKPLALPAALADRVGAELSDVARPWTDRMLLTAIGSGLIAACLIVVLLLAGEQGSSRASPASPIAKNDPPRMADSWQMLARVDPGRWSFEN